MPLVVQESAGKAMKQLRLAIFPEDEVADSEYVKKAREMMKKLMGVDVFITKADTKGERMFKNL